MTRITTMTRPSGTGDVHDALTDYGVQGNSHRIGDGKPFMTSSDVICIRTGAWH